MLALKLQTFLDETDYQEQFQPDYEPGFGTKATLMRSLYSKRVEDLAGFPGSLGGLVAFGDINHGIQWLHSKLVNQYQRVVLRES